MNVILYTRVSTDEQADKGFSLRHQIDVLLKYAALKGYTVVKHFQEDYSAKTFDRPEWRKLAAFCRSNKKNVDAILFTKWDRFSRNIEASYKTIREFRNMGIEVNSIEQPLDMSTPDSKVILSIYLSIPEVENDKISQRTREGTRRALKDGCYVHKAPFGYVNGKINGRSSLIPDPKYSEIVKYIFKEFSQSKIGIEDLRRKVNEQFKVKIKRSTFHDLLKKKVYTGWVFVPAYQKEDAYWTKGVHEPLIEIWVFNKVQEILTGKKSRPPVYNTTNKEFILRGVLHCSGCGKKLTASRSKGRSGYYSYYHCHAPCKVRYSKRDVDQAFKTLLTSISMAADLLPIYEDMLRESLKEEQKHIVLEMIKLKSEIKDLEGKIESAEIKLFDGDLPLDIFSNVKSKYLGRIGENHQRINEIEKVQNGHEKLISNALNLMIDLSNKMNTWPYEFQTEFINLLFPAGLEYDGNEMSNRSDLGLLWELSSNLSKLGGFNANNKAGKPLKESVFRLGTQGRSRTGTTEVIGV